MNRMILVTILCSLLIGCKSSPKKNYYYLTSELGKSELNITNEQKKPTSENITTIIGIGPIEIAEYLQRSQIILNQNSESNIQGDNKLTISDNDYWAEPLDKGIARVIALNLMQHDSNRSFANFPWRADSNPRYSLRLQVNSLTRTANQASVIATWELMDNHSKTNVLRRNFIRTVPVEAGAKNLAQAYSKLLAELANEMNEALRSVL